MERSALSASPGARIPWIDVAKGIGIILVFYGHLVERFIYEGTAGAEAQMKWVYSFHMPLFFFLAGLVYKARQISFAGFLKRQVATRLVPVWAFNIAAMLAWIRGEFAQADYGFIGEHGLLGLAGYCLRETLGMIVLGRAPWNLITWFLICLFTVELVHFCLAPLLRTPRRLIVSIVCFAGLTVLVDAYAEPIHAAIGAKRHWWQASSVPAVIVFYQLGILLRRSGLLEAGRSAGLRFALAGLCLLVTLVTFDLNGSSGDAAVNRALGHSRLPIVLLVSAKYGDLWWFAGTALVATALVIFTAQLLAHSRVLRYLGQITLPLMGLDGILHGFVNPHLARWAVPWFPANHVLWLTIACVLGTALSIAVCVPVTWIIEKHLPFALGRRPRRADASISPDTGATAAGDRSARDCGRE